MSQWNLKFSNFPLYEHSTSIFCRLAYHELNIYFCATCGSEWNLLEFIILTSRRFLIISPCFQATANFELMYATGTQAWAHHKAAPLWPHHKRGPATQSIRQVGVFGLVIHRCFIRAGSYAEDAYSCSALMETNAKKSPCRRFKQTTYVHMLVPISWTSACFSYSFPSWQLFSARCLKHRSFPRSRLFCHYHRCWRLRNKFIAQALKIPNGYGTASLFQWTATG